MGARILGAALVALGLVGGCTHTPLREPVFVEATSMMGPVGATACIAPSAWNCYDPAATRKAALDALEVADLARAVQKPRKPEASERQQLTERAALFEEEEALTALRSYVACHPWDLDLTFELARRNAELNRFSSAAYLFLRVAENSEDDRAVSAFLRALEMFNAIAIGQTHYECYDEMSRRVPPQRARLCSFELTAQHPGRTPECTELGKIAYDLERLGYFFLPNAFEIETAALRRSATQRPASSAASWTLRSPPGIAATRGP